VILLPVESVLKPEFGSTGSRGKLLTSGAGVPKAAATVFFHCADERRQMREAGSAFGPVEQSAVFSASYHPNELPLGGEMTPTPLPSVPSPWCESPISAEHAEIAVLNARLNT
jgi:hypothetical protein